MPREILATRRKMSHFSCDAARGGVVHDAGRTDTASRSEMREKRSHLGPAPRPKPNESTETHGVMKFATGGWPIGTNNITMTFVSVSV